MNKKELQEALREEKYKGEQLSGFIDSLFCWDVFLECQEKGFINLHNLKEALKNIPTCPRCDDNTCGKLIGEK